MSKRQLRVATKMAHELTEALKAVHSLSEGVAMRRRGLYKGSALWQAISVELEAHTREKDVLMQLNKEQPVDVKFINL
jgi:hypothetical protein